MQRAARFVMSILVASPLGCAASRDEAGSGFESDGGATDDADTRDAAQEGSAAPNDAGSVLGSGEAAPNDAAVPVRKLPGLKSITYYETSGDVRTYEFLVDGPEMSTKISTLSD